MSDPGTGQLLFGMHTCFYRSVTLCQMDRNNGNFMRNLSAAFATVLNPLLGAELFGHSVKNIVAFGRYLLSAIAWQCSVSAMSLHPWLDDDSELVTEVSDAAPAAGGSASGQDVFSRNVRPRVHYDGDFTGIPRTPVAWASVLRSLIQPVLARRGVQLRPIRMATACSGLGTPVVGLQDIAIIALQLCELTPWSPLLE
eukprot:5828643-Amphidinium_carterae.1